MINNVVFGQYLPRKSFIHRLSPIVKIICLLILTFTVFYASTVFALLLLLFLNLFLVCCSKINFKNYAKVNKFIIYVSVFISISLFLINYFSNPMNFNSKIFWRSLNISSVAFFRLVLLAISNSVFLFTTSISEISQSLECILYPLNFFGLNPRKFSLATSMSIKFVPTILREIHKIIIAQKSRGTNFKEKNMFKKIKNYSKIAIPLIINILKKTDALACSMISRGYSLEDPRTQFKKITIKKCDIISLFLFLTIICGVILCNNLITINPNLICEILH